MTDKFLLLLLCQALFQYGCCQEKRGIFFRNDYTYIARQNSFYKFHTLEKSWFEARKTCEKEGSTLFYPLDNTESKDIKDFWRKTQPQESIFIGISALVVKGVYETIDGQAVSSVYNKWAPGEPNDLDGKEDCVVMGRESGMFSDDDCTKKLPFICKKSFATLNWNTFCELPDPAYRLNGVLNSCYKFHLNPMNWTEAYSTCNTEQSHLAIIDSQAEADFLVKLIAEAPKDNIPGNYLRGAVHIGFHNRDMGGWRTITGTALEDSGAPAWCCNQPDGGDDELCGSIFYTGQLNDIGCWQKMFFICEHEIKNFNFNVDFRAADIV